MATKLSEYFLRRRWLLWSILAVNLLASVYGYYWYAWQFAQTPFVLWLFTPDCPLAATMMAAALWIYLRSGRRDTWFQFLTYTTLIKYGLWTAFVFVYYWLNGGKTFSLEYVMLFVSHLGMLAEGTVFLGSAPQTPRFWWLAAAYSAVFDYFDYFYPLRLPGRQGLGTYPWLPNDAHRPVILGLTLGITGVFFLVAILRTAKHKVPAGRG
ncbi:MAG: DUF1405 domain-containing protein [Bacteroidota bacterium]